MPRLLPNIAYAVMKPSLRKNLKIIENLNQLDEEQIRAHQLDRLTKLVKYTYQNNEFYRMLWSSNGLNSDIESLSDLNRYPIVSKKDLLLASTANNLLSKGFERERLHIDYTTGSTGNPFKVYKNRDCYEFHYAQYIAAKISTGYKIGDREVRLWRSALHASKLDRLKTLLTGKSTICIYDPENPNESRLTEERISDIFQQILEIRPKFIDGFVSALVKLSQFILQNHHNVTFTKAIYTGAEALSHNDRQIIEEAFKCPVYNRYGGTEFGLLGHECQNELVENRNLHATCSGTIIENDHDTNEIIITDLYNYAMPLIRYRTGDVGRIMSSKCSCGKSTKIFSEVTGRINDNIKFEDGSTISSHIWHNFLKKYDFIKNYQIEQYDYNKFTVRLDLNNNSDISPIKVRIANALMLEPDLITWEIGVDNIKVGAGGKNRQCISHLN